MPQVSSSTAVVTDGSFSGFCVKRTPSARSRSYSALTSSTANDVRGLHLVQRGAVLDVEDADDCVVTSGGGATGVKKPPRKVQTVTISGAVPLESWTEVFRCFVGPAARLGLKSLQLGIAFKLVAQDGQPLDPDHPTLKAMREAARQLGVQILEE